ncbi:helix-hairpin-helix domain-containing protein [Staphylococcus pettenkoferi]|uniref:helix-hairpin-helix domain-containing protein n=1 Tax=Staphylococcus pettenkoferi TaxID=170573 RepID=UPI003B97B8AE
MNTPTQTHFQSIPPIPPSKTKSIIQYTHTNPPFHSLHNINQLNRIDQNTFHKLNNYLTL